MTVENTVVCSECPEPIPAELWEKHVAAHQVRGQTPKLVEVETQTAMSDLWTTRYAIWLAFISFGAMAGLVFGFLTNHPL
jgi:hypothetical protein